MTRSRGMLAAVFAALLGAVVLAATASVSAAAPAPGKRLADYIYNHSSASNRRAFEGVQLTGGRTQVVNGSVVARDVRLSVLTRLQNTTNGWIGARDLCIAAMQGLAAQPSLARTVGYLWVLGRHVAPDANGDGGGRRVLAFRATYGGHGYCARDGKTWVVP